MLRGGTDIPGARKRAAQATNRTAAAIVLAAGQSTRMGHPKPLVRIEGRPLLAHTLDAVRRSRVRPVVVVLGHEADRIRKEIPLEGTLVVTNPRYEDGISTSLRAGIRAAGRSAGAYLIVLGDQPFVASDTLDALLRAWRPSGQKILIPTFHGVRGNPVLVDRRLSSEVRTLTGDVGCRVLFKDHPKDLLEVPVDDPGVLFDIDTPGQLEALSQELKAGRTLRSAVAVLVSADSARGTETGPRRTRPSRETKPDLLALAAELEARREPFVLATVVRVTKPTSGKAGNRAILRAGRGMVGWVGGSCTESAVRAESAAALRDGRPRLLRLSKEAQPQAHEDGVVEYTMECHSGGAMDIYLEPHLPQPQLLIAGDSPVAETLVSLGRLMHYHVTLVAPKATSDAFPEADRVVDDIDRIGELVTRDTYAVVATMGKFDEAVLRSLAPSPASYVGLVASRRRAAAVRKELERQGVPSEALDRIRNPAGLDLAAQTSEEIALSILAEVTKVRRTESPKEIPVLGATAREAAETTFDLVCGMAVDPMTPLRAVHQGSTYYFCSEACRTQFQESPTRFLH